MSINGMGAYLSKSDAHVDDAVSLLKRALMKCGIEPQSVRIIISDQAARKKLRRPFGFEKNLADMCEQPIHSGELMRFNGITISTDVLEEEQ